MFTSKKSWPYFDKCVRRDVDNVLRSGQVNQWTGPYVNNFEKQFCNFFKVKYSIAVSNGTTALELCLKALGLQAGDEVIVTPRTFIASALCCAVNNIKPVFVDVDINTQSITLNDIKNAITSRTKAVILVHLGGCPGEVVEISKFCKTHNIYLIEDCAQAHGAKVGDRYVGSFGDINAWSFCQDKIITTGGEGGMVTTNSTTLFKKAWSYKDHGKDYDKVYDDKHLSGFKWLHTNLGTNWRMTSLQAVIGSWGLLKLNDWLLHRNRVADLYTSLLRTVPGVRIPVTPPGYSHSYYKYYFFIESSMFNITRDELINEMNKEGVDCMVGSCSEVYKEKSLQKYKPENDLINTKLLFETSIMLKCDPSIKLSTAKKRANTICKVLHDYKK